MQKFFSKENSKTERKFRRRRRRFLFQKADKSFLILLFRTNEANKESFYVNA